MRIEQLTFTRFIAAISIVIYHYGKSSYLFNSEYIAFIFKQANIGVSYFFILSGFVMIIAYGNQENINFTEYIKNRLARIYPVYILAIFLRLAAFMFQNIDVSNLLLNVFMIQSWIPEKALTLNPPGWSLSVEMLFYISFPFLANRIYTKKNLKINTVSIILFWLISQILFHLIVNEIFKIPNYTDKDMLYFPLLHVNEFLIGNLAGLFFIHKLKDYKKNNFPYILSLVLLLILLLKFPIGLNFHNGLLALLFVPLLLLIASDNGFMTRLFSKKIFVFLGEISFGIYILQAPVWFIFSDYRMSKYLGLNRELDFTASFLIRFFILITVSVLSYLYFEKPIRALLKKRSTTAVLVK